MLTSSALKKMKKRKKKVKMNKELFYQIMCEYMINKSNELKNDRIAILNRISVYKLSVDDYYDLMVNDIRQDFARTIFRQVRALMDSFL